VVYLDAKTDTYLEEVSSCNIFVVKGNTIRTPPLAGTILPGVTRASIIELARSKGYEVKEEPVSVHEAMEVGPGGGGVVPAYFIPQRESYAQAGYWGLGAWHVG
jgi:hypothetical protein